MRLRSATANAGSLRRALALSSAGTAGSRIIGAFGGLFAARLLGPGGRGQLAILVLFATVGSMAAVAGVQFWSARAVVQTGGIDIVRRITRIHGSVVVLATVAVGVLCFGLIRSIADVGTTPVWLTIALAATAAINLLLLAMPNGLRYMGVVATATVGAAVAYCVIVGGLVAASEPSLSLVLLAAVIGNLVGIGIVLAWGRRAPRGVGAVDGIAPRYGQALRFGLPAGLGELVLIAMLRIDVLVVAVFLPIRDVGLYAVATALTEVLWIIPDGVAQVVLPTTSRDPEDSRTPRLVQLTIGITAVCGALLAIVARPLLVVAFGSAFAGAAAAVPLLGVAAIAGGVWKVVAAEVVARGSTTPRLTSALAGLVVMVSVDVIAVPTLGIAGAALGAALGYAMAAIIVSRAWAKEINVPVRTLLGAVVGAHRVRHVPVVTLGAEVSELAG